MSVLKYSICAFSKNSPTRIKNTGPAPSSVNVEEATSRAFFSLSESRNTWALYSPEATSLGTVIVYFNFVYSFGNRLSDSLSTVIHFEAEYGAFTSSSSVSILEVPGISCICLNPLIYE